MLALSLCFGSSALRIAPLTRPDRSEPLRTTDLDAVVRHPVMLCDAFWPLGLSLVFGSLIGAPLTPVWLLRCWLFTFLEEEVLVRQCGRR